jgi:hypothetical protein
LCARAASPLERIAMHRRGEQRHEDDDDDDGDDDDDDDVKL